MAARFDFGVTALPARSRLAASRVELAIMRLRRALKAFDPNQPRVPAGNPDGGQWSGGAARPHSKPQGDRRLDAPVYAQADFGSLIAEIPVSGGRRCVYRFGSIRVVVPGPVNFRCGRWLIGPPSHTASFSTITKPPSATS